jgi:hypothetical protein
MPTFDLRSSLEQAEKRFAGKPIRKTREDRGQPRLHPEVAARLEELLQTHDRVPVRTILEDLGEFCEARALRCPARATIYQWMGQTRVSHYLVATLPAPARETLYNLSDDSVVPGHQLAFHCLNYGDIRAVSFAAGLPWLALHQAGRLRGWRPRSKGLLNAICRARGI